VKKARVAISAGCKQAVQVSTIYRSGIVKTNTLIPFLIASPIFRNPGTVDALLDIKRLGVRMGKYQVSHHNSKLKKL